MTSAANKKATEKLNKAQAELNEFLADKDMDLIKKNHSLYCKAKRYKQTASAQLLEANKLYMKFKRLNQKVQKLGLNIVNRDSDEELSEKVADHETCMENSHVEQEVFQEIADHENRNVVTPDSVVFFSDVENHNNQECVSKNCGCALKDNLFLPPGLQKESGFHSGLPSPVRLFTSQTNNENDTVHSIDKIFEDDTDDDGSENNNEDENVIEVENDTVHSIDKIFEDDTDDDGSENNNEDEDEDVIEVYNDYDDTFSSRQDLKRHRIQRLFFESSDDDSIFSDEVSEDRTSDRDFLAGGVLDFNADDINNIHSQITCNNCHRRDCFYGDIEKENYHLHIREVEIEDLYFRSKLKFVFFDRQSLSTVMLCECCYSYLASSSSGRFDFVWPAFLWKFLTSETNISLYGDKLWTVIPTVWRYWWIDSVQEISSLNHLTLFEPAAVIQDRTDDCFEFTSGISSQKLGVIKKVCDSHLLPDVLCPWGCSEFMHQSAVFPFDVLIQRYFQKIDVNVVSRPSKESRACFERIFSARDDFLRDELDAYECHLLNPRWKVLPSVIFVGITPHALTCRNHKDGTYKKYIHVPRSPLPYLPSHISDQVCHAVINTRTIKPMKASTYSNTYQMHEQKGSFQGLDTCNVISVGNFSNNSHLLRQYENLFIANRPDIVSLLSNLVNRKCLSELAKDSMIETAQRTKIPDEELKNYLHGSTYVSLEDSMIMQCELSEPEKKLIRVIRNEAEQTDENRIVFCNPNWITHIIHAQSMDKGNYGCNFPILLKYRTKSPVLIDTRLLFCMSAMLTRVKELWHLTTKIPMRTSYWHGWMLHYLSSNAFVKELRIYKDPRNPFKKTYINSVVNVCKKVNYRSDGACIDESYVYDPVHLNFIFSDFESVGCFPMHSNFIQRVNDHHDIIILYRDMNSHHEMNAHDNVCDIDFYEYQNITVNEERYELRQLIATRSSSTRNPSNFDGTVYSRHGGIHKSWWKELSKSNINLQSNEGTDIPFDPMLIFDVAVFVKQRNVDTEEMKLNFLKYIGGQTHVFCRDHDTPFITAHKSHIKCCGVEGQSRCKKKVTYCCSHLNCGNGLCNSCMKSFSDLEKNFVSHHRDCNVMAEVFNEEENDDLDSDEEDDFQRAYDIFRAEQDEQVEDNGLVSDDVESYKEYDSDDFSVDYDGEIDNFNGLYTNLNAGLDSYVTGGYGQIADCPLPEDFTDGVIPSTDAGEQAYIIQESGSNKSDIVNGHVILNQACTLLSREDRDIKGYNVQKNFIQRIASTTVGDCIPLLYPEAMLFPSIFYFFNIKECTFPGAIPAGLLARDCYSYGFEKPLLHIRTRVSSVSSATSTNQRYIPFCWDIMANLALNRHDTRLVLNRGFQVADTSSGLSVNGKNSSSLHDSIDSKKMVRNLCTSQKYKRFTEFLTLTCNMKQHFGVKKIKNWIDDTEWQKYYPGFFNLTITEKNEVGDALTQAAAPLLLRNWMEVRVILLDYIYKSIYSPFHPCDTIFARDEYQDGVGNLPHIHALLGMNRAIMSPDQLKKVDDLIRGSYGDIVKIEEIEDLIDEEIIESLHEREEIELDAQKVLGHKCTERCKMRVGYSGTDDDFMCRKLNNLKLSPDNSRSCTIPLKNKRNPYVIEILQKIGLFHPVEINNHGHISPFRSKHPFFHPRRHIPATVSSFDINMSPVETKLFCTCRSMQNLQSLIQTNGTNKYLCKYCAKLDQQNYVVVRAHPHHAGTLQLRSQFLSNTKISSSAFNESKMLQKSRDYKHPRGRAVSLMQIVQQIFGYPEVFTDLKFIQIATVPLEERAGIERPPPYIDDRSFDEIVERFSGNEDGIDLSIPIEVIRRQVLKLEDWRQHSQNELHVIDGCLKSHISLDSITKFSVRPPELTPLIREVGQYYRWFYVEKNVLKAKECEEGLKSSLYTSMWIDGVQRKIKVRSKAFPEIKEYIAELDLPIVFDDEDPLHNIAGLFEHMFRIFEAKEESQQLSIVDERLYLFMSNELIYFDDEKHLPIPVYSYIKPTMGSRFILHIMLSMGRYDTEYDLNLHRSLRESLRHCELIGDSNEPDELEKYSDQLLCRYIVEQLVYFPNGASVTDKWILNAKHIFDDVIIYDRLSHLDIPPLLQADLYVEKSEQVNKLFDDFKKGIISAAFGEMRDTKDLHNIPSEEELMNVTSRENALDWDALENFRQSQYQSDESYNEQRKALQIALESIDNYMNQDMYQYFTKSCVIAGAPGSGKSFLNLYILLYVLSKGLRVCSTSLMAKRSNALGGVHIHVLFQLPVKNFSDLHRVAELAANGLVRKPEYASVLASINVLFIDEIGQVSAELISTLDILLRRIRENNIFFGGLLVLASLDHRQLPPVRGRPFLMSPHILTCFQFAVLKHSVRASNDENLQRIIDIARMPCNEYTDNILIEFRHLARNNFTFVSNWSDPLITPDVFRILSRKKSSQEACIDYISQVKQQLNPEDYIEVNAIDLQSPVNSLMDWRPASEMVRKGLDKMTKEPRSLIFFVGAVYEFTFNEKGKFSQSQIGVMLEMPDFQSNESFPWIYLYVAPSFVKDYVYNTIHDSVFFESHGWKKERIGCVPERIHSIRNLMKGKRFQYGLRHRVTSTIHGCQGDTLHKLATQVCSENNGFKLWDKAQVVVLLSRTRSAKDMIFVGGIDSTINCLVKMMCTKTQNSEYMEKVIALLDHSRDLTEAQRMNIFSYEHFPYDFNQIELPQCHTGFVYFLVSLKDNRKTYIGETFDLRTRLRTHNSGYGTSFTDEHRPWAVYAYISGFNRDKNYMKSVENAWQRHRNLSQSPCPKALAKTAIPIIENANGRLQLILHFNDT